jgi:hypothetical protein
LIFSRLLRISRVTRISFLALAGYTASYAGSIIVEPVTTPVGLAPGTQYQLAFVTLDGFFATSTSISDYNTDVSNEAALNSTLAAFDTANGVTWTIIGSTETVDANVNAPSSGLVYALDGDEVASGSATLYSGTLLSPIDIDQNGDLLLTNTWTGSTATGTAAGGINDLGQVFTELGDTQVTTGAWISDTNGVESDNDVNLYALSSVITVPSSSTTPEPGTIVLIPGALFLLFGMTRRRARN